MLSRNRRTIFLAALGATFAFRLLCLRPGLTWDDDFAQYIAQARALAEHRPTTDTGYVYNPGFPEMGPSAYPPGFPALLAPVIALFGLNFRAMQIFVNLLLIGALAAFFRLSRDELPLWQRLTWLALLGFSPVWFDEGNPIRSDIPFLLWTGLALAAVVAGQAAVGSRRRDLLYGAAAGLLMFAAVATRTIGVVLPLSLLAADVLRLRRISLFAVAATVVAYGLYAAESALLSGGPGYGDQLHHYPQCIFENLRNYPPFIKEVLFAGFPHRIGQALSIATMLAAAIGFAARLWRKRSVLETFFAGYLAIVLLWPSFQGLRLLLPLLPLYLFYLLLGLNEMAVRLKALTPARAVALLAVAAIVSDGVFFATANYGPVRDGIDTPDTQQLFAWASANAAPRDTLVFYRARALALFSRRRSLSFAVAGKESELELFCRDSVKFAIDGRGVWSGEDDDHAQALTRLIARHPERFRETARVGRYRIYRFGGCPALAGST